ncbi:MULTISPECIES: MarR family winged helix-turn-helix transcriptional regulator [unclassified Pseudactinotalea]|uniref:MarR family winged helix-turn-helix transcriptional regulator n=1 Tax=unclassified Pseudactinotalea TaxID=2649176 RepID=UPI00128B0148|nr:MULTISPECIES: MarR family transcriptional regulator [unclassified Pseudactinotalea]MPV48744.1 MarR family transcriptional regulator [Pseudactinotalea sp. HY160]QGH68733.1 MarR family transcriptional regulator [Pseudactinotalea sp. HY158]
MSKSRPVILDELSTAGRELSNAAVLFHAAVSRQMAVSPVEEKTLDLLQREGPLAAGDISARTGLAPASVTGLLDRLQRKGYVSRHKDATDGRRVVAEVEPGLEERFAHLFEPFAQALAGLYAKYTDDQLATILDFLERTARLQSDAARALAEVSADAARANR